jgi:ParB family chromosome partitioning protein
MIAKRFLSWIAKRPKIDSVFCSSVFNSVPFKQDRDCLMVIFQALCINGARLYLHTLSDTTLGSRVFNNGLNEASRSDGAILLDSEPGLYINEILNVAKVQKFHSKEELLAMGKAHFHRVKYSPANSASHGIKCEGPKEIDWNELVKAIEFEFDLPYPGSQRLGLVSEAISAFSAFTGHDLVSLQAQMKESKSCEPVVN